MTRQVTCAKAHGLQADGTQVQAVGNFTGPPPHPELAIVGSTCR